MPMLASHPGTQMVKHARPQEILKGLDGPLGLTIRLGVVG